MSLRKETENVVKSVVESTKQYLKYLLDNKEGFDPYPASNIRLHDEQLYCLENTKWSSYRCTLPIHLTIHPDSSATLIPHVEPGQEIEIRILDYDPRTGRTDLAAKEKVPGFEGVITIDFRWLVQRCLEWYREKGPKLSHIKDLELKAQEIKNAFEATPELSSEQVFAIQTMLTTGLSYVWGPPGTGKTKRVLANAVRHCVARHQRVLILASTNLSVDNALIAILEEGGVPKKKVTRIGIPSLKRFKDEYAECCEARAFQREIQQIQSQIKTIEDDIAAIEKRRTLQIRVKESATELENKLHELDRRQNDIVLVDKQINDARQILSLYEKELNYRENDLSSKSNQFLALSFPELLSDIEQLEHEQTKTIREIAEKNKELRSLWFFTRFFTRRKENLEKLLSSRNAHLRSVEATLESKRKKRDDLTPEVQELKSVIAKQKSSCDQLRRDITDSLQIVSDLERCYLSLQTEVSCMQPTAEQLKLRIQKSQEELLQIGELYTAGDINIELANRRKEKERLDARLLQFSQDLSQKSVLGMTLDGFMGLTLNMSITIDRVFIDEAPYAPLAKIIPLLSLHCPIAMLGDHRQLPPVCECKDDSVVCAYWAKAAIFLEDAFRFGDNWKDLNNQKEPQFDLTKNCKLTESYRFGESLASILRRHIYYDEIGLKGKADKDTLIKYVDCEPENRREGLKRQNHAEADKIVEWLRNEWKNAQQQSKLPTIAILTPYKNQVKTIQDRIKNAFEYSELRDHIEVLNTHKAQGREWDWVLFSVSDTGNLPLNRPFFTNSNMKEGRELLNTTISRAKQSLIIFLDMDYWQHRTPRSLLTDLANLEPHPEQS
ncbi:MAG: AAA domain-containing protein [Candidatus Aminicenantes bacterium]|nr:AAA domain-containing protein [Candidatus Aminicenantes bacterium]